MERVTITRTDVKKAPPDSGKTWKKLGIQTKQHGDKWLGCFYPGERYPNKKLEEQLDALKEGATVDIIVTPSEDGKFLNFSFPTKVDLLEVRVARLEDKAGITTASAAQEPKDDINPEDIPF